MSQTKELHVKQKAKPSVIVGVMLTFILFICGTLYVINIAPMTKDTFIASVVKETDTNTIGTNITLSQTIRGESDKITYRYKLETDCPFWKYEDRYVTTHPLTWLSDTAAVETEATSIKINVDGITLITGQYFYVPLLDLRQDDKTYEDFETVLVNTAYQQYCTDIIEVKQILQRTILITAFIIGLLMLFMVKTSARKKTISELGDTDISPDSALCYTEDGTEIKTSREDEHYV